MHEAQLARKLFEVVAERARKEGATRVVGVSGFVAETEALSAQSIEWHFAAYARGTPLEGAVLNLQIERVCARCRACGATYTPEHHVMLCPSCGSTDAALLGRVGAGVDSIELGDP
jgi:hydrogenase nickel incorporation protein HypA/HybF